jgi:hypothetical protein
VRSSAWHWVFSSKLNTTARSGGFMYRPTTSTSFSSNRGSLETLNVSTLQGFRSWSRQIRATLSLPIPNRCASVLVVQCVEVSGGASSRVTRSTSATVPSGSHDLRPRPSAILPKLSRPFSAKRARHFRMELALTPTRRAIS